MSVIGEASVSGAPPWSASQIETQLKPDERHRTVPPWFPLKVKRGAIWRFPVSGTMPLTRNFTSYRIDFMYNPSEITFTWTGNPDTINADQQAPVQLGVPLTSGSGTISLQLLFDRTYEVMGGDSAGVLTDVRAIERICGINDIVVPQGDITAPGDNTGPYLQAWPVNVTLGEPQPFNFVGVITSFGVKHTHFSNRMVPMRCAIDLTIMLRSAKELRDMGNQDNYTPKPLPTEPLKESTDPNLVKPAPGLGGRAST